MNEKRIETASIRSEESIGGMIDTHSSGFPRESAVNVEDMVVRYIIHSTEETAALAATVAQLLKPGDMILLNGPLGAGKTTFVQGLARAMGYSGEVTSPTFALAHRYRHNGEDRLDGSRVGMSPSSVKASAPIAHREEASKGSTGILVHVDLYRMQSPSELLDLALDEEMAAGAIVCIEWGGEGLQSLNPDHLDVTILPDAEYRERTVIFSSGSPAWQGRVSLLAELPDFSTGTHSQGGLLSQREV